MVIRRDEIEEITMRFEGGRVLNFGNEIECVKIDNNFAGPLKHKRITIESENLGFSICVIGVEELVIKVNGGMYAFDKKTSKCRMAVV